ncbi:MAG: efflux RND transporter periplasmic adaptor subunit [Planctomycetes bacterium]|nr:efflux RND transporter periplasmic adaptor subunit [Planctomycetota bacterium]
MNQRRILVTVAIVAGAGGAFLLGRATRGPGSAPPPVATSAPATQQVYTCSMHPQVRLDRPGKCPICEMPLVPAAAADTSSSETPRLQLSDHALAMASVETTPVTRRELARGLRAVGKIQYDESSLATVTARVDGYAERLFVSITGIEIKAGDHLAEVYSPDLIVAQQELLIALQGGTNGQPGSLVETAKLKLRRWGLTEEQIAELVTSKKIAERVTLFSPIRGTVIERSIVQDSAFRAGDALYRVANLDRVWVYLDVYEYDLAWVRYGQRVAIVAEALPGRAFEGRVTFVQPLVNEETRTVRVPVHVLNEDHALKPGMFVSAVIESTLAADGRAAATGVEGRYTCPMHPHVLREESGPCPLCEMPLEQIPGSPPPAAALPGAGPPTDPAPVYVCPMKCEGAKTYPEPANCPVCEMKLELAAPSNRQLPLGVLCVPTSAVLDSGTRQIVYVERSRGLFEPREVVLGPRVGELLPVLGGLAEGERVVTRGGFLIDSQFQITGQPSLFYPGGLMAGPAGHAHGGGDSSGAARDSRVPAPPAAAPTPHEH